MKKTKKPSMPKAHKPAGGKTARGVKFGGKKGGMKKAVKGKGKAKKMPFGATKAPGARKSQPAMKKAMGGKMAMKKSRKKKS
jgi:hypothetical protein